MTKHLGFDSKLKGMSVLDSKTGSKIGTVSDLILDPDSGTLLGIVITRPDKAVRAVQVESIHIGESAVMMMDGEITALDFTGKYAHAVSASELLGARLITEDGRVAGEVKEVHLLPDVSKTFYRVAESGLQRIFGGGFFISGDVPLAFSREGKRLIVPSDIEGYSRKSLDEAA